MASVCQEPCPYCGVAPCVGDRCPQWDDEGDDDVCGMCGEQCSWPTDGLCQHCWRFECGDDGEDYDGDEDWLDDALDPRDYEADQ